LFDERTNVFDETGGSETPTLQTIVFSGPEVVRMEGRRQEILGATRAALVVGCLGLCVACVRVSPAGKDAGALGVVGTNDANVEAGSVFARPDTSVDWGTAADVVVDRVVGSAPLGDAACAAHTQKAERLPLDLYVLLDSSSSMTEETAAGQTKWDAVRAALTAFLRDPMSAGIGVGLQYFPLTKPGVPGECGVDGDCGASGPCHILKTCAAPVNIVVCEKDTDCGRGDVCVPLGGCTLTPDYCIPVGGFCGGTRGVPRGNTCVGFAGYCTGRDLCEGAAYATPAVEVAPLPGAANALVASLNAHAPDGLTPTSGALTGAISHAQALARANPTHRVVVLLATDGLPSECAPVEIAGVAGIAAGGLAATPSISTFVIGVFAPDEQQSAQTNLDAIAAAGGTKQALTINLTQNVTQAFTAALNQVRTAALACQFKVPAAAAGETLDYYRVNVQFTSGAGQSVTIGNVANKAACDPRKGGWYYDVDPAGGGKPENISICDTSCTQLRGDAAGKVDVLLGCKTEIVIP
jgi:hypothetical protein